MSIELPQRDPGAAYRRKVASQRRLGANRQCTECGESRSEALIREKNRVICHECKRKERGMKTKDNHHPFGKANNSATIPVPVNDHRAALNVAQQEWLKKTLENPDRSPLLAAAASVRGFIDTILYLIKAGLHWIAGMLEKADAFLVEKFGSKWWVGTPLEQYAPEQVN